MANTQQPAGTQQMSESDKKALIREAFAPSDKIRAMHLGRKLKAFILNQLGDQETHFRIVKGAVVYLLNDIQQMDSALQDHHLVNDYRKMTEMIEELSLQDKVYEWGSEEEQEALGKPNEEQGKQKKNEEAQPAEPTSPPNS